MDWIFGLAMVLGIGPALVLMYMVVRNYTFPKVEQPFFSDPTFFGLLVVGMVAGAVLFFALVAMQITTNVVLMVIFAVIEAMVMVVVMNLKRFRGKSDSIFYGYALGLGMSCGLATGFCFTLSSVISEAGTFDASVIVLIVMAVSFSLMLGACGTTVGEGIARHRVMEFALQAVIALIVFNVLLYILFQDVESIGAFLYYAAMAVMLIFSAYVFYRTLYVRLSQVIREVLKMEGKKRGDVPRR